MDRSRFAPSLLLAVLTASFMAGCVPIEPKAECAQTAFECDQSLEEPYNSFNEDDLVFGVGGTCWQNEETAKACVAECNAFVAEELANAQVERNNAAIVGCGGVVE